MQGWLLSLICLNKSAIFATSLICSKYAESTRTSRNPNWRQHFGKKLELALPNSPSGGFHLMYTSRKLRCSLQGSRDSPFILCPQVEELGDGGQRLITLAKTSGVLCPGKCIYGALFHSKKHVQFLIFKMVPTPPKIRCPIKRWCISLTTTCVRDLATRSCKKAEKNKTRSQKCTGSWEVTGVVGSVKNPISLLMQGRTLWPRFQPSY